MEHGMTKLHRRLGGFASALVVLGIVLSVNPPHRSYVPPLVAAQLTAPSYEAVAGRPGYLYVCAGGKLVSAPYRLTSPPLGLRQITVAEAQNAAPYVFNDDDCAYISDGSIVASGNGTLTFRVAGATLTASGYFLYSPSPARVVHNPAWPDTLIFKPLLLQSQRFGSILSS